ncbi:MAG TPA: hypothetical protein VHK65_03035 [Candidatus Dormibacteraeota bacterium]|nr:hypothetical protein [Candidatus Dormibacteraeota bacterium]
MPVPSVSSTTAVFDLLPPAQPPAVGLGITCSRSIGVSDSVAIVQLHGGTTVLRDYADIAQPVTACSFGKTQYGLVLIDAQHVIVPSGSNLYAVVDLPQVRIHWFQLPGTQVATFLAIAPDLGTVAWLSADLAANTDQIHLTTHTGDKVVASLPNPHGGRCGGPDDSKIAGYSRSGKHLFILDQPIPNLNSLLVLEGDKVALRLAPDSRPWSSGAQPAFAVWSSTSETLYYRKDANIWNWTSASGPQNFLPGVSWDYPTISSDGLHVAFAVQEKNDLHTVSLLDLPPASRPLQIGNGNRTLPAFLNARQLWFKSESPGPCGSGGNQPLVYDLSDHSESPSIVDSPVSVWPATSSNF